MSTNLQFITDANGEKTAVIVPIDKYNQLEELLEDLHLSRIARETRDEERTSWDEVRKDLVAEGKLDE